VTQIDFGMSRRAFFAAMAAGAVVTAEGLWIPGQKLISIPSKRYFIPAGALAWFDDGVAFVRQKGGVIEVPSYFDLDIRGG